MPAAVGMQQRAAACRISVEWEDALGETVVGVWVPGRRTDSTLAVALGGRWFPGVHERARIATTRAPTRLWWRVDDGRGFFIEVAASASDGAGEVCGLVAGTCLTAAVGLSADHRGSIEAARMRPANGRTREVVIDRIDSRFIDSFRTARAAPSYVMEDVAVMWAPA
jgi:hypothetical protein